MRGMRAEMLLNHAHGALGISQEDFGGYLILAPFSTEGVFAKTEVVQCLRIGNGRRQFRGVCKQKPLTRNRGCLSKAF